MILAVILLIAGIVAVATRNSKAGGIVAGVFYIFAWVVGIANVGTYGDLQIWSIMCLIFGIVIVPLLLPNAQSSARMNSINNGCLNRAARQCGQ